MKKLYALCLCLLAFSGTYAQTTAQDWTKTDCAGKNHHLFAELDSGNVVVLEYVMMNCGSCVTAANGSKTIVTPFATTHPGKVRLYSIGYTNSYTCTDMQNWKTANNFTHPVFTGGAADVSYYGGMGMPTIVVVANNRRFVYYKKLGYSSSDNAIIQAAIQNALMQGNTTGISEEMAEAKNVQLYPNPVKEELKILMASGLADQVMVTDVTGKASMTVTTEPGAELKINTGQLASGIYFLKFVKEGRLVTTKPFFKVN